jgi:DNA-binding IclR family transcriptional regulator
VISEHDPVVARADLLLRSLRDALDETVLLSKVTGVQATYLLVFEATHPLRFMVKVGENVRSLVATSAGKAVLAGLDDKALTAFLKTATLPTLTERTITSRTDLRKDIELGRERQWFLNDGESLDGVTTLSARFAWNAARYIVTVAGPTARLKPNLDKAAGLVTNVCKLLEMRPEAAPEPRER